MKDHNRLMIIVPTDGEIWPAGLYFYGIKSDLSEVYSLHLPVGTASQLVISSDDNEAEFFAFTLSDFTLSGITKSLQVSRDETIHLEIEPTDEDDGDTCSLVITNNPRDLAFQATIHHERTPIIDPRLTQQEIEDLPAPSQVLSALRFSVIGFVPKSVDFVKRWNDREGDETYFKNPFLDSAPSYHVFRSPPGLWGTVSAYKTKELEAALSYVLVHAEKNLLAVTSLKTGYGASVSAVFSTGTVASKGEVARFMTSLKVMTLVGSRLPFPADHFLFVGQNFPLHVESHVYLDGGGNDDKGDVNRNAGNLSYIFGYMVGPIEPEMVGISLDHDIPETFHQMIARYRG